MELKYTYQRSGEFFIGRLDMYPGQITEADSLEELETNLKDIFEMMSQGELQDLPYEYGSMVV